MQTSAYKYVYLDVAFHWLSTCVCVCICSRFNVKNVCAKKRRALACAMRSQSLFPPFLHDVTACCAYVAHKETKEI